MKITHIIAIAAMAALHAHAQTGTANEPVQYIGGEICNPRLHDGGFRYAIGTENIQVTRANRTHPEQCDGFGWTYNHAPNITYWHGRFYLEYLSNPKDEQQPPGQTFIVTSRDGRTWGQTQVAFPPYKAPEGVTIPKPYYGYIMHQRMGFYTAPNGKLLAVAFYGHSYNPFKEKCTTTALWGRFISYATRRTPHGTRKTPPTLSTRRAATKHSKRHAARCSPTA